MESIRYCQNSSCQSSYLKSLYCYCTLRIFGGFDFRWGKLISHRSCENGEIYFLRYSRNYLSFVKGFHSRFCIYVHCSKWLVPFKESKSGVNEVRKTKVYYKLLKSHTRKPANYLGRHACLFILIFWMEFGEMFILFFFLEPKRPWPGEIVSMASFTWSKRFI